VQNDLAEGVDGEVEMEDFVVDSKVEE